jgi:hypothetical protein
VSIGSFLAAREMDLVCSSVGRIRDRDTKAASRLMTRASCFLQMCDRAQSAAAADTSISTRSQSCRSRDGMISLSMSSAAPGSSCQPPCCESSAARSAMREILSSSRAASQEAVSTDLGAPCRNLCKGRSLMAHRYSASTSDAGGPVSTPGPASKRD